LNLAAHRVTAGAPAAMLLDIKGIVPEFAAILWSEGLSGKTEDNWISKFDEPCAEFREAIEANNFRRMLANPSAAGCVEVARGGRFFR
jgi:hypothetical protein